MPTVRPRHSVSRGVSKGGIALVLALGTAFLSGCDPQLRYRVLTSIFDDVPPAGVERPERKPMRTRRLVAWKIGKGPEQVDQPEEELPPEPEVPEIETVHTWDDAVAMLPKNITGEVDWVEAVRSGTVAPRGFRDPDLRTPMPFPLDIVMDPESPFTVTFPHFSHTLWLDCSNCHPSIFKMQAGSNEFEMEDVFAGKYCGRCHGKVAFDPRANCVRCHTGLRAPPRGDVVDVDIERARTNPMPATTRLLRKGKVAYAQYCVMCHGEEGDGVGAGATYLDPKPRDFRQGTYKFRTTPGGSLPLDADIFRTITMGAPGTSMPAWARLSYEDRWGLVHYVKSFSDRFEEEEPAEPINFPEPVAVTDELLEQGAQLWKDAGCSACHGDTGDGNGQSASGLHDDWGYSIRPADFLSDKPLKSGPGIMSIYRTVMTGLNGTPMPDFGEVLGEEYAWPIMYHVVSLRDKASARSRRGHPENEPGIFMPDVETVAADLAEARANPVSATAELLELGALVYFQQCAVCHGEAGDGAGMAAENVDPKPRDFRQGTYKFRTTPGGVIPTDADIYRTITVGVPGTSMPPWSLLPREERWALVHYLKTFSSRFEEEEATDAIEIPEPMPLTPELMVQGAQLFKDAGCSSCHGELGRGDGPSAKGLADNWGYPIRPANFASGRSLKSGPSLKDIYRTIMTGLDGTPMPSFGDVLDPELAWPIVYHVLSLAPTRTDLARGDR